MKNRISVAFFLQISASLVFIGRAWQHILWEAPYRALLWDEQIMKKYVEFFTKMTWTDFTTSALVDEKIQLMTKGIGVYFLFCAVTIFVNKNIFSRIIISVGTLLLCFLAWLNYKENFFQLGQLLEYSLQIIAPFLLALYGNKLSSENLTIQKPVIYWLTTAMIFTFFCHGLFATNFYPCPGDWKQMAMNFLRTDETKGSNILYFFGVADFIFCGLFFLNVSKKTALLYFIFWGFVTTFARLYSNFHFAFWQDSLLQWIPEFLYRTPHFLLPLVLYAIYSNRIKFN